MSGKRLILLGYTTMIWLPKFLHMKLCMLVTDQILFVPSHIVSSLSHFNLLLHPIHASSKYNYQTEAHPGRGASKTCSDVACTFSLDGNSTLTPEFGEVGGNKWALALSSWENDVLQESLASRHPPLMPVLNMHTENECPPSERTTQTPPTNTQINVSYLSFLLSF